MGSAYDELVGLTNAVQLTPGNHPSRSFAPLGTVRRHHGFDPRARRRPVWSDDGGCLVDAESVHPPRDDAAIDPSAWLEARAHLAAPLLETMYPGYLLGTGAALDEAMRLGVPLAVDVSHVFMQLRAGVMDQGTWRRLREYEKVGEVHVSANDGTRDAHAPIAAESFGLDWARAKLEAGTPVVLECYMHRLGDSDRRRQVDLVRGGAA